MKVARRAVLFAMILVFAGSIGAPRVHANAPEGAGAATLHEPREGEEPEGSQPRPMNWFEFRRETPPFLAMIINFGILVFGYYLFGRKPIAAALQNRRDSIAKAIEEAHRMRLEAETRAKVYQAKLERLEQETRTARDALVRAGEAERDRIVADAQAKAERMRRDAQFLIEQELKQVQQDLWRDALDAAVAAAEDLLRKRVSHADQERLAEEYLVDLGGRAGGARTASSVGAAETKTGNPA